jgi:hypothetical protein
MATSPTRAWRLFLGQVTAKDIETGVERSTTTNDAGIFS